MIIILKITEPDPCNMWMFQIDTSLTVHCPVPQLTKMKKILKKFSSQLGITENMLVSDNQSRGCPEKCGIFPAQKLLNGLRLI
jgi:hypothetical protein